jgi:hypothetical protein
VLPNKLCHPCNAAVMKARKAAVAERLAWMDKRQNEP